MRRALWPLPLALAAALSGCGGGATLSGKVTYQGQPVTSGSVIVLNADGTAESGVIRPDGTYTVEGVQKGPVKVGVLSPDPAHARSILVTNRSHAKDDHKHAKDSRPAAKAKSAGWFPLPHELGDPEKSGLGCEVTKSRTRYDIDLK
jgi:hypothetical protein